MITMHYWQKFSKHFAIRVALPHLLLGVMATAFSFSDQSSISVRSHEANIITIASVMVNIQEHQSDIDIKSQSPCTIKNEQIFVQANSSSPSQHSESITVIRLTPNNGIRAGPIPFIASFIA